MDSASIAELRCQVCVYLLCPPVRREILFSPHTQELAGGVAIRVGEPEIPSPGGVTWAAGDEGAAIPTEGHPGIGSAGKIPIVR